MATAVAELHAYVAGHGYAERDIQALRLLAANGFNAERAAAVVLVAMRHGDDAVKAAEHMLQMVAAFNRR